MSEQLKLFSNIPTDDEIEDLCWRWETNKRRWEYDEGGYHKEREEIRQTYLSWQESDKIRFHTYTLKWYESGSIHLTEADIDFIQRKIAGLEPLR